MRGKDVLWGGHHERAGPCSACTDGASRVQDIAERLLAAVHGVHWTGPDFDRFAVEALRSTALITAAGAALTDRAAELHPSRRGAGRSKHPR